jgi:hypothetical protein
MAVIQVRLGITVISDCWTADRDLYAHGNMHNTARHSNGFVDGRPGAYTDTIECTRRLEKYPTLLTTGKRTTYIVYAIQPITYLRQDARLGVHLPRRHNRLERGLSSPNLAPLTVLPINRPFAWSLRSQNMYMRHSSKPSTLVINPWCFSLTPRTDDMLLPAAILPRTLEYC